ncbi:deoxyribodipyrimidine photo-lyase [Alkalibacterium putridalgicola]|uniref:Deoxyribodipyrimidine photo-lyase n=1 Tax=Alkalibacterium putridalgicola TaxID=426703 RepID=A0A1H7XB96_9LACT|nr:deoxyribodipyrimidine photo-lyase [Alkalibacterium putridalgicola]GEK88485.1 deoxyribodipyrimidine photo-lyase [Alkalibacterium putridalgicola]SEM30991.1 deoxyribodipyrimidine photo-lyase [Alkalibacterium putridalgicola]
MNNRITQLKEMPPTDKPYVIYWMQASQRTEYNHALEYAIKKANELSKPLLVYFGLTADFPEANARHYAFMLQGLKEVEKELGKRKITFILQKTSPEKGALSLSEKAALMVVDRGYLRIERDWRQQVADQISCPLVQIETNVIVPVEVASDKEEYAARTIRSKIHKQLDVYTEPFSENKVDRPSTDLDLPFEKIDLADIPSLLDDLGCDESVPPVDWITGGTSKAKKRLADFIEQNLEDYAEKRNEPGLSITSDMSPYLHFGQISPLYIYHQLEDVPASENKKGFIEEVVVRRELSMNFVFYNNAYDTYDCLPDWARETLAEHADDERETVYSLLELETADTGDPYWNAAQSEMVKTGKMHGYMRMYWGKKIIEWTKTPEDAFLRALYLNNKYHLDGRDPNSFTGIAWVFGKHDHGWKERPVFGKVRYMNAKGLERKFDMSAYLERVGKMASTD